MISDYNHFLSLLTTAIQSGQGGEDDSNGYALINYSPEHKIQLRFVAYANTYLPVLESVLKSRKYSYQREVAAEIISYSGRKKDCR